MSKDNLFHPASLACDRIIMLSGPLVLMEIDLACHTKTGAELGVNIAQKFSISARDNPRVKAIMDGGLLFHLKMECISRQNQQKKEAAQ